MPAAEAVVRVNKQLEKKGLGIVIFDGYRPWTITKLFWDVVPEDKRKFVANPTKGSKHNRGCAVDLSIYDRTTGELIPMPSAYDEFTERASPDYQGCTDEERANREMLRQLMEAEGFTVNPNEWWHFDYKDWEQHAIYDISFKEALDLIMNMSRPQPSEYDPYYQKYISLVPEEEIISALKVQMNELAELLRDVPEAKGTFAYADGKWTIKEVVSHLIDGERIFAYRVFRIARGDKTPIEGFEQDGYIENSHANRRSFTELLREFDLLREANLTFFSNLETGDWVRTGTANNVEISVRSLAWIMVGHIRHHVSILQERYLAKN